jgi:hypothetical protein
MFDCTSPLSVGPAPGFFYIYGHSSHPVVSIDARADYLTPSEPYRYGINQYSCTSLKTLEEKLLQFPVGSTFSVAYTGDPADELGDWAVIGAFLRSHGYSFKESPGAKSPNFSLQKLESGPRR